MFSFFENRRDSIRFTSYLSFFIWRCPKIIFTVSMHVVNLLNLNNFRKFQNNKQETQTVAHYLQQTNGNRRSLIISRTQCDRLSLKTSHRSYPTASHRTHLTTLLCSSVLPTCPGGGSDCIVSYVDAQKGYK